MNFNIKRLCVVGAFLILPVVAWIVPDTIGEGMHANEQNPLNEQNSLNSQDENMRWAAQLKNLSREQLRDTADFYYSQNMTDKALICLNLFVSYGVKNDDPKQAADVIKALNRSAILYYLMDSYTMAYELLIKALDLCEKYEDKVNEPKIHVNIGNIYARLNEHEIAKRYFLKALNLASSQEIIAASLNNVGIADMNLKNYDSALHYFNQALESSKHHDAFLHNTLGNIALIYRYKKEYDSAYHYFQRGLKIAQTRKDLEKIAIFYNNIGDLFLEMKQTDSTLKFIDLSNKIAENHTFLKLLADNYRILSEVETVKGNNQKSFEYFKEHVKLKDSIFNSGLSSSINQLHRSYEITKTNRKTIEELTLEQQVKKRTIRYQQVTIVVILLAFGALLFIFLQNRNLNRSYDVLFEKNVEIIKLEDKISEPADEKYKKSSLTDDQQDELINHILTLMEDTAAICDPKFSLEKLAEQVQSNRTYVSQVINTVFKKNFISFLNTYRIREAQRLFLEPDTVKYTVEFVASCVGFKSPSSFRNAFKEITGLSPKIYLKSVKQSIA